MANAPEAHARLSPSAAHRWTKCAASLAMCERVPHESSSYADEGTAAHELAAKTLITEHRMCDSFTNDYSSTPPWKFTPDMCREVQKYVDAIGEYSDGNILYVERRVDFSHVVGVPDSFGTADCIIITADLTELQLHDLKFGHRPVSANRNEQLMTYALGALKMVPKADMIDSIRLVIHQPRLGVVSEWTCTREELELFALVLKEAGERALAVADVAGSKGTIPADAFAPGEKTCQWCDARKVCPALAKHSLELVTDMFVDLSQETAGTLKVKIEAGTERLATEDNATIAVLLANVDLIEGWTKAVRAHANDELLAGRDVPGYKLVQGKQGNRAWADDDIAEQTMKGMRLKSDDMYTRKVISPTVAEKLLKAESPRRWKTLQPLITRSEGGKHVAPESDPRPAIVIEAVENQFADLTEGNVDDLL